jgi:hypothetical protein
MWDFELHAFSQLVGRDLLHPRSELYMVTAFANEMVEPGACLFILEIVSILLSNYQDFTNISLTPCEHCAGNLQLVPAQRLSWWPAFIAVDMDDSRSKGKRRRLT